MLYYLLSVAILLLFLLQFNKKNEYIAFFILLLLLVPILLRGNVGTDYKTYLSLWNNIVANNTVWYKEPGFILSIKISHYFGLSSHWYYSIFSSISLILMYISCKKSQVDKTAFLLIFFVFLYLGYLFNIIRQGLVMSFLLYSIYYIYARKINYTLAIAITGMFFHIISLLIIPLYFWCSLKIKYLLPVVILSLLLGLSGFFDSFSIYIFNILLPDKVQHYFIKYKETASLLNILNRFIMLIYLLFIYYLSKKDKVLEVMFKIFLFGISIYFLLINFNLVGTRIYMFCSIMIPFSFGRYYYISNNKLNKNIIGIFLFIILLPSLYIIINSGEFDYNLYY